MSLYFSRYKEEEETINKYLGKNPDEYRGTYIDIGSNQYMKNSNTFYYYIRGWKGLLIDPNPAWADGIKKVRPKDIFLPIAVMDYNGKVEMRYDRILENDLDKIRPYGKPLSRNIYTVECRTMDTIIEKYPEFSEPDFVSIDIEGSEDKMLSKCNFLKFKPKVICIEYIVKKNDFRNRWEHYLLPYYELKELGRVDAFYLRKI